MPKNENHRNPDNKELSINDYENLKCETLLKYGCPESELWLTECTTTENFKDHYGEHLYFDLELDKYKYVVYYHESGSVEQHQGFNNEKEFEKSCKWIAGYLRKEVAEWQEGVSNLGYYKHIKDRTLLKHGFPQHSLKYTNALVVLEAGEDGLDKPYACLIYNESGKLEDMLGYEPFKSEEEFEEVCRKMAEYFKEAYENRLANLNNAIKNYQERIMAEIGRVWTHQPQEQEGTYEFSGQGRLTRGINKGLTKEEINLIFANVRKRIIEKKLEIRNKVAVAVDYLQVFTAEDDKKVYVIDQLNHEMKESGEFQPEDDHWTMMFAEEY